MTSRVDVNQDIVVRFAPSPNGLLHLGHAYAAMIAHDYARAQGGKFLVRIEDIDPDRTKSEFVESILTDLHWLGLQWDEKPIFQSDRLDSYADAAQRLKDMGLLYPCFCTRSEMRRLQEEHPQERGPDGPIYAGTCRYLHREETAERVQEEAHSWRLNVAKAADQFDQLYWHDEQQGDQLACPETLGDVVIVPKEAPIAYHLAVTLDDDRDRITHVVRGEDLFASTHIHRLLQALLQLPTPKYVHHPLLLDESDAKLAKSRDSASLTVLRNKGVKGQDVVRRLRDKNLPVGISLSRD